jgi:tight adherence protein C
MFGTPDFEALVNIGQTYLAIRIGQMRFSALDTCILVLALSAALLAAFNLWRIAQREDRQRRLLDSLHRASLPGTESTRAPSRPPWYQRLGTTVAATRIIGAAGQKRLLASLLAAGVKGDGHLATVIAGKACSGAAFVPVCWLLLEWRQFFLWAPSLRLVLLAGAFILGWRCPEIALSRLAARRRVRLETGIPDALDLLVICVQAGLSLDHAVEQVSAVLSCSSRDVAEEFAATAAEMRVSAVRGQALENLAQRTGLMSLRSIVAALSQSINFGTPLAEALRVLAAQMRVERLARFEERAARLPVLLTMPLMAFILPSLMIVIGTPLVLHIVDALGRHP